MAGSAEVVDEGEVSEVVVGDVAKTLAAETAVMGAVEVADAVVEGKNQLIPAFLRRSSLQVVVVVFIVVLFLLWFCFVLFCLFVYVLFCFVCCFI